MEIKLDALYSEPSKITKGDKTWLCNPDLTTAEAMWFMKNGSRNSTAPELFDRLCGIVSRCITPYDSSMTPEAVQNEFAPWEVARIISGFLSQTGLATSSTLAQKQAPPMTPVERAMNPRPRKLHAAKRR